MSKEWETLESSALNGISLSDPSTQNFRIHRGSKISESQRWWITKGNSTTGLIHIRTHRAWGSTHKTYTGSNKKKGIPALRKGSRHKIPLLIQKMSINLWCSLRKRAFSSGVPLVYQPHCWGGLMPRSSSSIQNGLWVCVCVLSRLLLLLKFLFVSFDFFCCLCGFFFFRER